MLGAVSAFSGSGQGLCVSNQYKEFTGGGYTGYRGAGSSALNSTQRIATYLKRNYSGSINKVQDYLEDGKFEKAIAKLEDIKKYAEEYAQEEGYEIDDDKMLTILNKAGANYENYADTKAKSSFATGLFNGIPLVGLFFNSNSKNEIKSKLNGEKVDLADKIKESAGKTLSSAAFGLALSLTPLGWAAIPLSIAAGFGQNAIKDWVNAQ